MAFVGDAVRYVTSTVDARLVTPVANRLANSVANPYVLSYFLWDRIKKLTPQRARDLTRLLSSAVANGLGVLSAEEVKRLAGTTRRLQDELIAAAVTPQGKNVVLNSVATAAKVAQALNTPETKVATQQLFETLQSFVDFFASAPGRKVIATAGDCVSGVCEVLASPESAVLLAEVATNMCHALEVEALRRDAETAMAAAEAAAKLQRDQETNEQEQAQEEAEEETNPNVFMAEEDKRPFARSRFSSAEDTSFETESEFSLPSRANTPATGLYYHPDHDHSQRAYSLSPRASTIAHHEAMDTESEAAPAKMKERSALRSARIEKDVLLKMGVSPSMLEDVQRILDQLREEQAREEAAATTPVIREEDDEEDPGTDNDDNAFFSSAFGTRTSSLPLDLEPSVDDQEETKTEEEEDGVVLPEWHPEPLRAALRRRHVAAEQQASERTTYDDQSREMTQVLAKRQLAHGDLPPADALAVRVISFLLVLAFATMLLLCCVGVGRAILA